MTSHTRINTTKTKRYNNDSANSSNDSNYSGSTGDGSDDNNKEQDILTQHKSPHAKGDSCEEEDDSLIIHTGKEGGGASNIEDKSEQYDQERDNIAMNIFDEDVGDDNQTVSLVESLMEDKIHDE